MKINIANKINLVFGVSLFLVFLLTGYYMLTYFKPSHLEQIPQRLQIRSNHIYILFISFLNIMFYLCRFDTSNKIVRNLDLIARVLIVVSGIFGFIAFCYEHDGDVQNRMLTLTTMILSLLAVSFLLLTDIVSHRLRTKA